MQNIVMIGMPGSGKSTLGKLVADRLGMKFLDTDKMLELESGKPLQQMVDELNPKGFSLLEETRIAELDVTNTVIATGGSVALEEKAMQHLTQIAKIIFIDISYEEIEKRLYNLSTRGITFEKGQTLRDLYDLRQPYYHRWADIDFKPQKQSVEKTAQELCILLKQEEKQK